MAVIQERVQNPDKLTRIISIRVSEMEYKDLQRVSRASGARSIADIARHSIQQTLLKCATDSTHSVAIYMYLLHQTVDRLVSDIGNCAEMLTEVTRSRTTVRRQRKALLTPNSSAVAKTDPLLLANPDRANPDSKRQGWQGVMKTLTHRDIRRTEETLRHLPPGVPAEHTSAMPAPALVLARVPDGKAAEDAGHPA